MGYKVVQYGCGLFESVAMIAAGLEWELDDITDTIEPVTVESEVHTDTVTIKPGHIAGLRQVGQGWADGKELITLDFQAYIGAGKSYDAVYITGTPNQEVILKRGIHGDIATGAIVVNCIPTVIDSSPGLVTMNDLPVVHALPDPY